MTEIFSISFLTFILESLNKSENEVCLLNLRIKNRVLRCNSVGKGKPNANVEDTHGEKLFSLF